MLFLLKMCMKRVFIKIIRRIFVILIMLMLMMYVYIYLKFKSPNMKMKSPGDGYTIKTIGCSIPSLNPFDPSVIPFIFKDPPVKCGNGIPPLVISDLDTLHVNIPVLLKYNVTNLSNFSCCYQEVLKKELSPGMYRELSNDTYTVSQKCIQFTTKVKIDKEHVRVICKNNGKEIYRDFHSFVPFKKSRTKRPSVLVIGIDSTSRVNLHRQMPKTAAYLRELNAIEFFGYNKVADNTFPNLVPALTGKSVDELHDECLTSKWYQSPRKFDSCKFIWDKYKRAGFLTALAEDAAWVGVFSHGYNYGFQKQPTDYYWNLFDFAMETEMGYSPNMNVNMYLCVGSRFIYRTLLDYMDKFLQTLKTESFFGWFWQCTLTHTDFNLASLSDEDYKMLFIELNRTNALNNTFVIFLSDHGARSSGILLTHQGYLESRLPFMYVLVPPWFHELYPRAAQNLKVNAKRLVTTFDLHETLKDLVHVEELTTNILQKREDELEDETRGISLFLPISGRRTCRDAGISVHWCSCFQSVPVERTDLAVKNIAFYVVNYINLLLNNHENCAKLALSSIVSARLLISEEFRNTVLILKSRMKIYNYIVTIETAPGGGIFESTVRCFNCDLNGDFEVQGQISRLNKYGKDGNCLMDSNLQMYCYCQN